MTFTISDFAIFGLTLIAINLIWSLASKKYNADLDIKRRIDAAEVLRSKGLTIHLYLAGVGIEDDQLHKALNFFGDRGYIIMDKHNQIVGKIATMDAAILPVAAASKVSTATKPAFLKLVVDNSEN